MTRLQSNGRSAGSATQELLRYRARMLAVLWTRAVLLGGAAGLLCAALAAWLNVARGTMWWVGGAVGLLCFAVLGGRWSRGGVTIPRTALWIEELVPSLRYSLVTLAERGGEPMERFAARVPWQGVADGALRRSLLRPAAALLVAVAFFLVSTSRFAQRAVVAVRSSVAAEPGTAGVGDVSVELTPPSYTRESRRMETNPSVVSAVAGSRLTLSGALVPNGQDLRVFVDSAALTSAAEGGKWTAAFTTTERPVLVRLTRGDSSRLIGVEPRVDSVPGVVLFSPERDTVFRTPVGTLDVAARASDDFGIDQLRVEYLVTTGSGERFTFRSGQIAVVRGNGRRAVEQRTSLTLGELSLQPGDVVHLRAVARDQNSISGPGTGVSETRTLRIARAGEYDSVAVEQAPPPDVDKALLSQRMLINLTEALIRKAASIPASVLQQEVRSISRDQARLRKQVSDVVFSRLGDGTSGEHFHGDGHDHDATDATVGAQLTPEALLKAAEKATEIRAEATDFAHDETPVVAVNRPLLEAYNAMWEAGRQLDARELRAALPPMYVALDAIQRARAAERIYLRGAPARLVVDLNKVRLQGDDKGASGTRRARGDDQSPQAIAERRTSAALRLAVRDAGAAADSLLVIRLQLLNTYPVVAGVLGRLSDGLRNSRDVTEEIVQLRRAFGVRSGVDAARLWSVVP